MNVGTGVIILGMVMIIGSISYNRGIPSMTWIEIIYMSGFTLWVMGVGLNKVQKAEKRV